MQFRAEKTDILGPTIIQCFDIDHQTGIFIETDFRPVARHGGQMFDARISLHALGAQTRAIRISFDKIARRIEMRFIAIRVDNDFLSVACRIDDAARIAQHGQVQGARHNRDMRAQRAFFQYQPAQFLAVIVQQFRRAHCARQ